MGVLKISVVLEKKTEEKMIVGLTAGLRKEGKRA